MNYKFVEEKPHTEWTNEEANKVAKAFLRLELESRELRKELSDLKALQHAAPPDTQLTAATITAKTLSNQSIVELAIKAGYGIISATESPPTYEMRRAVVFARSVFMENWLRAKNDAPLVKNLAAKFGGFECATGEIHFPNWVALESYGSSLAKIVCGVENDTLLVTSRKMKNT